MDTVVCPKCGTENAAGAMNCKNCRINLQFAFEHIGQLEGAKPGVNQVKGEEPIDPRALRGTAASHAQSLRARYADAYAVASSTVGFGHFVQIVGIVLGVLIALSSVVLAGSADLDVGVIVGAILAGCAIGVLVYGLGTQIAAQGQLLLASLDSAVNSSPFLSEDQKASIMRL